MTNIGERSLTETSADWRQSDYRVLTTNIYGLTLHWRLRLCISLFKESKPLVAFTATFIQEKQGVLASVRRTIEYSHFEAREPPIAQKPLHWYPPGLISKSIIPAFDKGFSLTRRCNTLKSQDRTKSVFKGCNYVSAVLFLYILWPSVANSENISHRRIRASKRQIFIWLGVSHPE